MPNDYQSDIVIADSQQLKKNDWSACVLLVKLGKYEVQVGLYRPDTKYFLRLLTYTSSCGIEDEHAGKTLQRIFSESNMEPAKCRKVHFIIDTPLYTLVPEALYRDALREEYFSFLFKKEKSQVLHTDRLVPGFLIYPVDKTLLNDISIYSGLSVTHSQAVLLNNVENKEKSEVMYVTLQAQDTYIVAYSDNELLLAQSYRGAVAMDVVYHILNVAQRLNLSEAVELRLTGHRENVDEIIEKLGGRFNQINWLQRPGGCQFPTAVDQYPGHYFYHLVSLALCES